jgi:hypothetical protein
MKSLCQRLLFLAVLALALPGPLAAADSFSWNKAQNRVNADVRDWTLPQLLESVAAATGWEVYLDPGASHVVSARFSNLASGEALRALLGDLNFIVLPRTNASSQLYVFRTSQQQATRLIRPPCPGLPRQFPTSWWSR